MASQEELIAINKKVTAWARKLEASQNHPTTEDFLSDPEFMEIMTILMTLTEDDQLILAGMAAQEAGRSMTLDDFFGNTGADE